MHIEKRHQPAWLKALAWLLIAAALLALILGLSRCGRDEHVAVAPGAAGPVVAATPNAMRSDALIGTSTLAASTNRYPRPTATPSASARLT